MGLRLPDFRDFKGFRLPFLPTSSGLLWVLLFFGQPGKREVDFKSFDQISKTIPKDVSLLPRAK